jgi:hypothetical protein
MEAFDGEFGSRYEGDPVYNNEVKKAGPTRDNQAGSGRIVTGGWRPHVNAGVLLRESVCLKNGGFQTGSIVQFVQNSGKISLRICKLPVQIGRGAGNSLEHLRGILHHNGNGLASLG